MYGGPPVAGHNRGVANTRKLRQTFQNPSDLNVGQINLSFDVTGGSTVGGAGDTGLRLAFYEVDDVLAGNWTPGNLIKEVVLQPGNMPGGNEVFRLDLTGGDVFALPQRNAGSAGYGMEISTPNSLSSDGAPGVLWFTDVSATSTDYYTTGRYYTESGTASTSYRDVGISLVGSTEMPGDPGDVNRDMMVDLTDLSIIAAHFRQSGDHDLGDLTGNGFIDFDDFQQWKQNYPGAFPGSAAAALFGNVPEPGSFLLLVIGAVASGRLPRRRQTNAHAKKKN
jgi:hypothetical protein